MRAKVFSDYGAMMSIARSRLGEGHVGGGAGEMEDGLGSRRLDDLAP